MDPARLVLFLLLVAMSFQESCAAPWRARGADDELRAPFPDAPLDPDFMPVPGGQPREVPPVWALPGHRFPPVLEPSWNPSSPEREEDESKRGKYSQGSSRLLKRLLKEMEKAERGTDQQSERDALQEGGYPTLPVPDALQEGGYPTLPVPDRGMQAAPTGMPGMNTGKSTEAAAHTSVRKRHIPVTVSAMLLPALVLAVGVVIWVLKDYLARKREKRAAEAADGAGEGNETDSDPVKQESP